MGVNISVIKEATFREWFLSWSDKEWVERIAEYGAQEVGPFIYHSDTTLLYEHFKGEVWELVGEVAETYYGATIPGWLAQLNRDIDLPARFESVMVQAAAEYLALQQRGEDDPGEEDEDHNEEEGEE